jgi:hypothetical protein
MVTMSLTTHTIGNAQREMDMLCRERFPFQKFGDGEIFVDVVSSTQMTVSTVCTYVDYTNGRMDIGFLLETRNYNLPQYLGLPHWYIDWAIKFI